MTNEPECSTGAAQDRMPGPGRAPQTRANTIVKAADHATPLELSNITIRYGGDKGGAERRQRRRGLQPDAARR